MRTVPAILQFHQARLRMVWPICFWMLFVMLPFDSTRAQTRTTLWSENWESGINQWFATNGVWQAGIPTTNPPAKPYAGQNCAGTILNGFYPANANSRLVSPEIALPAVTAGEELQLRFWHWFNLYPEDPGVVEVSTDNRVSWTAISKQFTWNSNAWTMYIADLTKFADSNIHVAFHFTSNGGSEANGWYIDELSIVKGNFTLPHSESFELGIGDWYTDQGVWEIGAPKTNPPVKAHTGQNCAGTVLSGFYPAHANTRLISPRTVLPTISGREKLQLRFWHWFNQYPEDPGVVQISLDDGANWTTISNRFEWNSNAWTQYIADISTYAGTNVRFSFYFVSNAGSEANGWYIDDVSIVKGIFALPDSENFDSGIGDWYADKGVWEVGVPSTGPGSAHSRPNCAATVLSGHYPARANTRLISPEITLEAQSVRRPELFFWHWFNIYPEDIAVVQVSVAGGPWVAVSDTFSSNSGWTQYYIDLLPFANTAIRLAFYFTSSGGNEANGWYIDDIRIDGVVAVDERTHDQGRPTSYVLHQNFPNPFNPSTTILYDLPRAEKVEVAVFDLLGKKIFTLKNQHQQAGQHRVRWDGRDEKGLPVPSGVYVYRLRAGGQVQTRKMILLQ